MAHADWETLNAVRDSAKKVLETHLIPNIESSEHSGVFYHKAHEELGKLGLAAPMLPEAQGGADDLWMQLMVAEEMGYANAGFGLSSLASTCLYGANVGRHGTEEQKNKFLPGIIDGSKIGCWGLTEPGIGSNAVGVKTSSRLEGDEYILNGSKTFITNAPVADFFVIITREYGDGFDGGTAFLLERGMEGLTTGEPFKKMGHRSSPTGEVFMENVRVPKSAVLGEPGKAFYDMKHSLDVERIIFSGLATGMMRFCLDATSKYVLTRKQFGKPIGHFQMIQDMIAKMAMLSDASEKYLYDTCEKLVAGEDVNKQAAMAKLFLAESLKQVADYAIQCHGGYGYMEEYQVERVARDAKLFEIGAGTSEIQKLIVAKQVLGEAGKSL